MQRKWSVYWKFPHFFATTMSHLHYESSNIYIILCFQEGNFISINLMVHDVCQSFLECTLMKDTKDVVDLISLQIVSVIVLS